MQPPQQVRPYSNNALSDLRLLGKLRRHQGLLLLRKDTSTPVGTRRCLLVSDRFPDLSIPLGEFGILSLRSDNFAFVRDQNYRGRRIV